MHVLHHFEQPAVLLHHHAEIEIKRWRICRKTVIEGILHIAPGKFLVGRVNIFFYIFRIKVFQWVESAIVIHLSLHLAVFVDDHDRRHAEILCHPLVVGSESIGNVDYSCSIFRCHVIAGDHPESLALLDRLEPRNQLLVMHSN